MSKENVNKKSNYKRTVFILLSIILICSIILLVKIKVEEYLDNQKQIEVSKVLDTIDIPSEVITPVQTERILQVRELQKGNSEVVGWLQIEGTNINYPVCQGKDNDYYLTHNYKNEKVTGGSAFLDKDYDFNIPSSNLLIYGHRNKKGLMFEDLIKFQDENFYKEHKTIRFTTENEDTTYEILAAFNSKVYKKSDIDVFRYYYFVNANNRNEYNDYISNSKKTSLYDTGIAAEYGEQLLTLSTCEYSQTNGRFAVVAKKIK